MLANFSYQPIFLFSLTHSPLPHLNCVIVIPKKCSSMPFGSTEPNVDLMTLLRNALVKQLITAGDSRYTASCDILFGICLAIQVRKRDLNEL